MDALLAEENVAQETQRIRAQLMTARLTTFESFDFSFQPSLDRHRILTLAQRSFIDRCQTVHLLGPSGVGWSHLAIALGVAAPERPLANRPLWLASRHSLVNGWGNLGQ